MPNKNIIISILLLVLVFLINFNIIELLQGNYKENFGTSFGEKWVHLSGLAFLRHLVNIFL